ncbi:MULTISPECIES: hypothetical protein [Streptomyces]|uniref:hypothetical protein n=1 Tax=Streptomyces TaxID=1883 RepID=UPI002054DD95|nr:MULTISPECIES: hypothetical protein [Streptomyces]UPT46761.1 hypothetical protein MWG59_38565 [Streptomyces sp. WAC00303]WIY80878.1 hypothetical protein QPM16_38195 [Streptomyces anulatus]
MTRARNRKQLVEPGLIPAPGELLDWRDSQHFDQWQDQPCALCQQPTPMRSHAQEPVHKACAESWIAANPVEARRGRFASDSQPKSRHEDNQA